jgi:signal peptidase I
METENGVLTAPRYLESLDGREHAIFKLRWEGELDNTQEFVVGPDQIFVMGDNRDDSADSRLAPAVGGVGFVPVENLVGRVDAIIGSWDPIVRHDPVWTWPSGLRLSRFFSRVN